MHSPTRSWLLSTYDFTCMKKNSTVKNIRVSCMYVEIFFERGPDDFNENLKVLVLLLLLLSMTVLNVLLWPFTFQQYY